MGGGRDGGGGEGNMNSKLHSPPSTCPEAEDLAGEMTCIVGMISESPGMCAKDKTYANLI